MTEKRFMHSNCIIWTVEVIGMEERGGKERRKDDEGGWLWSKGQWSRIKGGLGDLRRVRVS